MNTYDNLGTAGPPPWGESTFDEMFANMGRLMDEHRALAQGCREAVSRVVCRACRKRARYETDGRGGRREALVVCGTIFGHLLRQRTVVRTGRNYQLGSVAILCEDCRPTERLSPYCPAG